MPPVRASTVGDRKISFEFNIGRFRGADQAKDVLPSDGVDRDR